MTVYTMRFVINHNSKPIDIPDMFGRALRVKVGCRVYCKSIRSSPYTPATTTLEVALLVRRHAGSER